MTLQDSFYIAGSLEHDPVVSYDTAGQRLAVLGLVSCRLPLAPGDPPAPATRHRVIVWDTAGDALGLKGGDRVLVHGQPPVKLRESGSGDSPPVFEFTALSVRRLPPAVETEAAAESKTSIRRQTFAALRSRTRGLASGNIA